MKKFLSAITVIVILAGSLGLAGCEFHGSTEIGGTVSVDKTFSASGGTGGGSTPSNSPTSNPGGGGGGGILAVVLGDLWADIPVYAGASQLQQSNWPVPPADDQEYAKLEWKYYESADNSTAVATFYKAQMPAKGWTQQMWTDNPAMSMGAFTKNSEKNFAMIYIVNNNGKTALTIMSAVKK